MIRGKDQATASAAAEVELLRDDSPTAARAELESTPRGSRDPGLSVGK